MNEKQVTVLTIVLLAVILLVGGAAGYYFYFVLLAERKQDLANLNKQVSDAEKKRDSIPSLESQIAQLEDDLKELLPRIPMRDRLEYDRFANLLDGLRRRAGVQVPSASYSQARASRPVPGRRGRGRIPARMHKVEYNVDVKGTFYQLIRYINLLEDQKRFIKVQEFSIVPAGREVTPGMAPQRTMNLKVYTFTYKQTIKPEILEVKRPLGTSIPPPE